jgi:hypothetical protein
MEERIAVGTGVHDIDRVCLELERLGLLPVVVGVTEMTVRGGLEVDGLLEVELTHYSSADGHFVDAYTYR